MTIADGDNRIQYTGNGATSVYSTGTIIFYAATDLIVTERVIATGVETTYVKDTDYTVSGGSGAAGSITLLAGNLPSTKQITIERSIPYEQQSDYIEAQEILAEEIETSLDKLTVMTQQIKDQADRSLKFSTTLSSSLVPVLTDAPVDGQLLAWSGTSGNVENASLASMSSVLDTVLSGVASGDFLQYNGTNWVNKTTAEIKTALNLVQNNYAATTAPGVGDDSDDGYSIGSQWYDGTNDNMYHCLDATVGAAVWVQGDIVAADLGSAAVATLIDDDTFATATSANIPSAESVKAYADSVAGGLLDIKYYTAGTTWTKPAGLSGIYIEVQAAGGEGESSGGTTGAAAADTSFGAHAVCEGGNGGQTGMSAAVVTTGLDLSIDGRVGVAGGVAGGDAPKGNGQGGQATGNNGSGKGAGGAGGNTGFIGGGSGAYTEGYIDAASLGATETVTIGAAGGGTTNGGDGAGGYIKVWEFK